MGHFLKKVLEKANTFKKLSTIDPADKNKCHCDSWYVEQLLQILLNGKCLP